MLARTLLVVGLLGASRAQSDPCCDDSAQRLQFDQRVEASVASGAWSDFYFVAENEGDSLVFEVTVDSPHPTAAGVYVYDGLIADVGTPASSRCVLCNQGTPRSGAVAVTQVSALHPASGVSMSNKAALDMDTASHIGNSTHRRYFVYVGECYHMAGSVYYLSVFGQSPGTVRFNVEARRVVSMLTPGPSSAAPSMAGSVCDGKYMHYYVDWDELHGGGMQAYVRKTSGSLQSFFLRKDTCAGPQASNIASVNLLGHGCVAAPAAPPGHISPPPPLPAPPLHDHSRTQRCICPSLSSGCRRGESTCRVTGTTLRWRGTTCRCAALPTCAATSPSR